MPVQMMNAAGRASLQLGRGVDSLTGAPLAIAIIPDEPRVDPNNSGQIVSYDVSIIETSEELESSLGLSVGAEMRYGLFSASGKFEMKEKTQFKSFATYVLAKCDVRNPPIGLFDPREKEEAAKIVNVEDKFRRAYGDHYVRAAMTGGEFYVAIEIVHEDTNVQKSIAASMQAEYNGFLAGGQVNVELSAETKTKASSSRIRVVQYQASGTGTSTSLVDNPKDAILRLKAFPQIARDNPVATQVELAPYDTIPRLQVNFVAQDNRKQWLNDCARIKARVRQVIDELDFLLTGNNREFFDAPPSDEEAQQWKVKYREVETAVMQHAEAIAAGELAAGFNEPAGLPVVRLKRITPPPEAATVSVPDLMNAALSTAVQALTAVGLVGVPRVRTVPSSDATTPLNVVLSQSPQAANQVPRGSTVELGYAAKKSGFMRPFLESKRAISSVGIAR